MKQRIKLILAVTVASCLWAGCTTRQITLPNGASYSTTRFGNKESIGRVSVEADGLKVVVENYASDQVQAIGAVAEGVAKGLAASVKP